jgi:hypothetical protein
LLPFNALWCVLLHDRYYVSTPAEGLDNACTIGVSQAVTERELSLSSPTAKPTPGQTRILSTDWGGIGDLAVPCSHERPAKDRPVDL